MAQRTKPGVSTGNPTYNLRLTAEQIQ